MGVNTKGLLIGHVKKEDILNFIRQKYDSEATIEREDERHAIFDNKPYDTYNCFIYFNDNIEKRNLQIYFDNTQYDVLKYK